MGFVSCTTINDTRIAVLVNETHIKKQDNDIGIGQCPVVYGILIETRRVEYSYEWHS